MQSTLSQLGFPPSSAYWQIDLVSPRLGDVFQGTSKVSAQLGDRLGAQPGHIRAAPLLRISQAGQTSELAPTGNTAEKDIAANAWTDFAVPAGARIEHIVLRIRGDWARYTVYEGTISVDQVGMSASP